MQARIEQDRRLKEERPLGDLFSDLATETSNLVKQEVALAKVELAQKANILGKNIGFLVIGGAVGYASLLALIASLIMLLAGAVRPWLAALIVGGIVAGVAWLLISSSLSKLKRTELTPRQTVETLKEDAQWVKEQVK